MIYLRRSTASQEVLLGPFVDDVDAVTAETGLTIANTDIKIWKAGATTLADKSSGGATHISNGNYYAVLNATDTNTLGSGVIVVQVTGALAVRVPFTVLAQNVYDSIIGGNDLLDVSVAQWLGTAPATPFIAGIPIVHTQLLKRQSTAQAGSANTITMDASAAAQDCCPGDLIYILSGSGAGQSNIVYSYNSSTRVATMVQDWPVENPGSNSVVQVWKVGGIVPANVNLLATAAQAAAIETDTQDIQSNVGDLETSTQAIQTSVDELDTLTQAIQTTVNNLDTSGISGIPGSVMDTAVEGTVTLRQAMRVMLAVLAGRSSGHPTNPVYRDINNTTNRVEATVDESGNRSTVSVTL